jgi:long-chain acyl-CoA synthetase
VESDNTMHPWFDDYPPHVPHTVELRDIDLGQLLRQTARENPANRAIVFLDSMITYAELDNYVDRFAASLYKLGLSQGDVVALMLPNSHQFVVAFYRLPAPGHHRHGHQSHLQAA